MKRIALLIFAVAMTISCFAQYDPISEDRRRKGIDSVTQLLTQYKHANASDTLRAETTRKGHFTKNTIRNKNKITSFTGQGKNYAGEIDLFDSSGNNYIFLMDSLGKWTLDSYRPYNIRIRHVRALNIDTTNNKVTVDSALTVGGPLTVSNSIVLGAATIFKTGSGSPEGVVTAPIGSLWLRTDGSTSTTLYVKTTGAGNTGWTAK